jgi:hypothetical protein
MEILKKIFVILGILCISPYAFAQSPKMSKDSMMIKMVRHQERTLNLSQAQSAAFLNICRSRQQRMDSLGRSVLEVDQRGRLLADINGTFYQQIKKEVLTAEQWEKFIIAEKEKRARLKERMKMKGVLMNELPVEYLK